MFGWLFGSSTSDTDSTREISEDLASKIEKKSAGLRYIDNWPGANISQEVDEEMEEAGYEYVNVPNEGWQWVQMGNRGR